MFVCRSRSLVKFVSKLPIGLRAARLAAYALSSGDCKSAHWAARSFFTPSEVRVLVAQLTDEDMTEDLILERLRASTAQADQKIADAICRIELTGYMRNQLLRDSDVMSMAHGLSFACLLSIAML